MTQRARYCFLSLEDGNDVIGWEASQFQAKSKRVQGCTIAPPRTERLRGAVHDCTGPITYGLRVKTVACNPPQIVDTCLIGCPACQALIEKEREPEQEIIAVVDKRTRHFERLQFETKSLIRMDLECRSHHATMVGADRFAKASTNAPQLSTTQWGGKRQRDEGWYVVVDLFLQVFHINSSRQSLRQADIDIRSISQHCRHCPLPIIIPTFVLRPREVNLGRMKR